MKRLICQLGLSLGLVVLLYFVSAFRPASVWAAASFSLSPATKTVTINSTFTVDVLLDTGGDAVSGATFYLTYDPTLLMVVDSLSGSDVTSQGINVQPGTIFNQSPLTNTVDATTGTIHMDSGSLGTSYNSNGGRGVMATVTFQALAVGSANVNFTFNPNATTNTSLVALEGAPTNILTSVNNGTYTVTATQTQAPLPQTGTFETTLVVLGGGASLLAAGWYLSRKVAHESA